MVRAVLSLCLFPLAALAQQGIFEGQGDIGTILHKGSLEYLPDTHAYRLTGSGDNVWGTADAFQFAWKKMSGDVSITADIAFPDAEGDPHKKAMLMIRQSLDDDSAYADVALHGNGLTSLQSRDEKGAATHEIESNVSAPKRLRLTRIGDYFYMSIAGDGEELHPAGGAMKVALSGPFYIGIGASAHSKDQIRSATFSNLEIGRAAAANPTLYSTLETVTVNSTDRRVVYTAPERFEAPNWTRDNTLLFNGGGKLYRIPAEGGKPTAIDTGFASRINNDHGISPDGALVAISDQSQGDHGSRVYTVPVAGGTPVRITERAPSYWHGWSPDGKTLVFTGQRDGNFDIYSIPVNGGEETRLTTAEGLDDGPEYSPDGHYIYFNSGRTGTMQIWRMKPDGSG